MENKIGILEQTTKTFQRHIKSFKRNKTWAIGIYVLYLLEKAARYVQNKIRRKKKQNKTFFRYGQKSSWEGE